MAREHNCPNCGPQPCNASTSKIHTCGVCAAIWEEDLSSPAPVLAPTPATPKPAAAVAVPPKPASLATPASPVSSSPPGAKPIASPPTSALPAAASPPRPSALAAPATPPAPSPIAPPKPASPAAPGGAKTLADVLQEAKVKRCPKCESEGLAQPSDFLRVQGRLVLVDSQTYRAHQWFADTGDLLPTVAAPPPAPFPASVPPARSSPAS